MPLSHDTVLQIRQRYADGVPVSRICAEFEIGTGELYGCVDGGPPGAEQLPPLPRRRSEAACDAPETDIDRQALVARLWQTACQQVEEIEQRLARVDQAPPERERDTRMLAVLVKTLREITALDQAQNEKTAIKDAPHDDDDAVPRDLDELRRELARRVDLIRQGRDAAGPAGGPSS